MSDLWWMPFANDTLLLILAWIGFVVVAVALAAGMSAIILAFCKGDDE